MLFERQFIFHPKRLPDRPGIKDPALSTIALHAQDGTQIAAWHYAAEVPTEANILYFHGNGGNLTSRYVFIQCLSRAPAAIYAVDYRGYGRSEGAPTEDGLYQDAEAIWRYMTVNLSIPSERIVLFGESLGGAVAINLAQRVHSAGLIVQSTFTSIPEMAGHRFPFLPSHWIGTQMRSVDKISEIHCPKLVMHGSKDRTIPIEMGRRLYEAASEPKEFLEVRGANHGNVPVKGAPEYWYAIFRFVHRCTDLEAN